MIAPGRTSRAGGLLESRQREGRYADEFTVGFGRAYLEQNYGFRCTCSVCSLPEAKSKASDARLSRMASNWARFAKWIDESIDGVEALRLVREIWKDADEEGYLSERGRLAADAVWVSAGHRE